MLNHPCIPGINSTWSWCVVLLVCYGFSVLRKLYLSFSFFFFIPYLGYSLPGIPNTILNCSLGNLLLGSVRWPISCYSEVYLVTVPPGIIMLSHFGHVQLLAIYGAIACQEPLFNFGLSSLSLLLIVFQVVCLFPLCLFHLLDFYLVLSSAQYFSVFSFFSHLSSLRSLSPRL